MRDQRPGTTIRPSGRFLRRKSTVAVVMILLLIVSGSRLWEWAADWLATQRQSGSPPPPSSTLAFEESYLNASSGKPGTQRTRCTYCHPTTEGLAQERWDVLRLRDRLSRDAWSHSIQLPARCGTCHVLPDPSVLPWASWSDVMGRMKDVMDRKQVPRPSSEKWTDIAHFYYTFSPENQRPLDDDPDPSKSPLSFQSTVLGNPIRSPSVERPVLGHVGIVDLDQDANPDVLVCDTENSNLTWIHRTKDKWEETILASVPYPGRARPVVTKTGAPVHIAVSCLGTLEPTDDLAGSVVLLINDGAMRFTSVTLLKNISRVADVQPGDFDGDGDVDFVIAAYGYLNQGEIGWLENTSGSAYVYHCILNKTGAIDVLPVDLNTDGRLDFIASFAQEHEEISAFINHGTAGFEIEILFKAATPSYGISGAQLIDLDSDGDQDIVFTNGDNMDLSNFIPRPYHGVQWLENTGNLNFVWHDIYRFYGAYCAVPGDLNNDGKVDLVVTSMFNDWTDPKRASLIWLENDGRQHFRPHSIAREPIHLISAAIGDLNGDSHPDIVACGMNAFAPFERMSRVTLWLNSGQRVRDGGPWP